MLRMHVSLTVAVFGLLVSGLYVLRSCRRVYFSEVVSCVQYTNTSTFIACVDGNGLIILEVVQC